MSRIYFHSPSGTLEIYGRERAWMGCLTDDVACGVLGINRFTSYRLARFLPPGAFPLREHDNGDGWGPRFADALGLWVRQGGGFRGEADDWIVDGQPCDRWQLSLNTVLAVGNDPLKLCARLHAQCEIHAYVEGPGRAWLAGIVREGVRLGIMRDAGYPRHDRPAQPPEQWHARHQWTDLASWLESRADEPVVTSYGVCDQFPNRHVAGWEDDSDGDGWYDLSDEERWRRAMVGLRADGPRLDPSDWATYRFGHGKDAFWLMERAEAS